MQPLERLVNLVALLLESRAPLTFERIREKLAEAYEHEDTSSAKRMFERDKDLLRDIGVPIDVSATDPWDVEHGYSIPKERYYLPEIAFTPDEISALMVAARTGGDTSAEDAVRKLLSGTDGAILTGRGPHPGVQGAEPDPGLSSLTEAVAGQRRVRFEYRSSRGERSERLVDAYGLAVRGGRWYLVGLDRGRGEIRSFRLSRMSSEPSDEGEGTSPPEGFRASDHVQAGPWAFGEERTTATVAFAPQTAWWATRGLQGAEVDLTREDGWVEVSVPQQPGESIASWVLSFGPDAEALEPPELRDEIAGRLEELIGSL